MLDFSFWDRTYIDRSLSCQFEFLGPHPYRLTIFLSSCVRLQFPGPHLYQSVIFHVSLSSVWVFRTAHILISHLHVNSVFGTAPISIGHYLVSWVDFCSSSSHVCLVESCSILSNISFFEFILYEDRSFLILLIIESFIVSWSSVVHCVYTHRIVHISLSRVSPL